MKGNKRAAKVMKAAKDKKIRMYKGLPLVDADEDMGICVTKMDVSTARKQDPANCAAANAIRREYKTTDVEVHLTRTYMLDTKKKQWVRFMTPENVSREIIAFDRAASFEPGNYVLKAPTPSERLGQRKVTGPHTTTTGKKKYTPHRTVNVRASALHDGNMT